jgi:predicted metal-dependent hydrolase
MSAKSKSPRLARKIAAKSSAKLTQHQSKPSAMEAPDREAELFARGVTLFNTRYFFEAHEAWEEIWLHTEPPEKTFLQGLIQVTAAFHHHSRNNLRGTKSLLRAGLMKLEDFPPHHRGLHVEKLRSVARNWLAVLDQREIIRWPALPRIAPAPNRQ